METQRFILCAFIALMMMHPLSAINRLDMITFMEGEFYGSQFGYKLVSMDFNGDGYEDLIVHSPAWNPTGVFDAYNAWGRIYFYWGGPDFDNVSDYTITGTHHRGMTRQIINAGDVNGDGIEDLMVPVDDFQVAVYYGGPNSTDTPDLFPDLLINTCDPDARIMPYPLGDVNGDGKADIAFVGINPFASTHTVYVWTGIDQPWHEVVTATHTSGVVHPYGVGDVNNDGYADYVVHHNISGGTLRDERIVLYYGNQNFPQVDSLVISTNTNGLGGKGACPLGDVNNDGYDDFIAYHHKIWYGGENITTIPDLALVYQTQWHDWTNLVYPRTPYCIYGDLNGDGYDDVIGSDPFIGYYDGEVGIWLGAANMDSWCDLHIRPPQNYRTRQFGWDKVTGDFNGDGLCDLAVSAPEFYAAPQWAAGCVFVYSGNTRLVANEDLLIPEANSSQWQINLFPNPCVEGDGIHIDFEGDGYKHSTLISLDIYNLKGQKMSSMNSINPDSVFQLPEHITSSLISGIYIITVKQENKTMFLKKLCIIK